MARRNGVTRRDVLKVAAATPLLAAGTKVLAVQGSPPALVPADKGLPKDWKQRLYRRGRPEWLRGDALRFVGMPVGGIGCGQMYLSGDGKLWYWDVFNAPTPADLGKFMNGERYVRPVEPEAGLPVALSVDGRELSRQAWRDVSFLGEYPVATIRYRDPDAPVSVEAEVLTPWAPLATDDSSIPAALYTIRVRNLSNSPRVATVAVDLQPVPRPSLNVWDVEFVVEPLAGVGYGAKRAFTRAKPGPSAARPDILVDDFERESWAPWVAEGTAFGTGPMPLAKMPNYQGFIGGHGNYVVNSHQARNGENVNEADAHVGRLLSPPIRLDRPYLLFRIGGGNHAGKTCMNLLVDGKVARTAVGPNNNRMREASWDVREFVGKDVRLEIVDDERGGWGHIGVDWIVQSDRPGRPEGRLEDHPEFGEVAAALLSEGRLQLGPNEEKSVTIAVAWYYPNPNRDQLGFLQDIGTIKRHYARFGSAEGVLRHLAGRHERLAEVTRRWRDTWYDSTLPRWFLDRTMANTSTLQTQTCYRFDNGRFYGWEGIYCCAGTCTHVWHYAQAVGRLFPDLERDLRERVDFGIGWHPETGIVGHRAEAWQDVATDGQCGNILRAYREHLQSKDDAFLRRLWPKIKRATEYLIGEDPNEDGILEGRQFNTLDAAWYGKIAWISGLYVATLRASEAMARRMGDRPFADRCARIAERGRERLVEELYNGEYFIQKLLPGQPAANNTNNGCHIDQVLGQSWAFQVGLPRVTPKEQTVKALRSLYRYNFTPDAGGYREQHQEIKGGRLYALRNEPGLLMCTFPRGGASTAAGHAGDAWAVAYFNECMSGFEHMAAAHMIWEGLVDEGATVVRAIHERYDPRKRNPYNEIECSDHYARAMASYGAYLAAAGMVYDGPAGRLEVRPNWPGDRFRGAFVGAEGWGTVETRPGQAIVQLRWGKVELTGVRFPFAAASAALNGRALPCELSDGWTTFAKIVLEPGDRLVLKA